MIGCLIEKQIATPDQYPLTLQRARRRLQPEEQSRPAARPRRARRAGCACCADPPRPGARAIRPRRSGAQVPAALLQHGVRVAAVLAAADRHRLRAAAARPADARRAADTRARGWPSSKDPNEVETALDDLVTRPDGPFVARLPREPGRRDSRYMQLFTGAEPPAAPSPWISAPPARVPGNWSPRIRGSKRSSRRSRSCAASCAELRGTGARLNNPCRGRPPTACVRRRRSDAGSRG